MGPYANPTQTRPAQSFVFELTVLLPAGTASDSRRKKTFTLDRVLRIGAHAGNHIVIEGEGIGLFHARFIPGLDGIPVLVLDDGSVSIDGVVAHGSVGLIPGDVLSIGGHQLRVSAREADEDCPASKAVWQLVSDGGRASVQLGREIIIGSAATCEIRITDADVATRHAQLVARNGVLWIRDFSDGATFVNETPVRGAHRPEPGDTLRIGQQRFRIDRHPQAASNKPDVIAAVTAVEDRAQSSPSQSPSADATPAAEAAQSLAAIWEMDDPSETSAGEGPHVESAAVFERHLLSSKAVANSPPARTNARAEPPRVAPLRVDPRVSMRVLESATAAPRVGQRTARWRMPALLLVLTLAWGVAIRPSESRVLVSRILDSQAFAVSFDRVVEVGRSVRQAAIDLLRTVAATASPKVSESAVTPSESASAKVLKAPGLPEQPTNEGFPAVTSDIIELQRKAAAGDGAALAHLKELGNFYAELASSAMARGDRATAKRHMAMVVLLRSTTTTAESTGAAAPPSVSHQLSQPALNRE